MTHLYYDRKTAIMYEFLSTISVVIYYFERELSHFSNQTSTGTAGKYRDFFSNLNCNAVSLPYKVDCR